jgi:hypothetical protein
MKDTLILDIQQFILIYSYKSQLSHNLGILSVMHIYVNGTLPTVSIKTALKENTFQLKFLSKEFFRHIRMTV